MIDKTFDVQQYLAIRREEGMKIDPATAEVDWDWTETLDPYGVEGPLPEDCRQVGRTYFARRPGSDIWVAFCDLPKETAEALYQRCAPSLSLGNSFKPSMRTSSQASCASVK